LALGQPTAFLPAAPQVIFLRVRSATLPSRPASVRRRSREAGFDFHIVKPVELAALERLLARPVFGDQEPME